MYKNKTKPFFLVWTPATGYAMKRHKNIEPAIKESERLAKLKPNLKFHVLMAVGDSTLIGSGKGGNDVS